MRPDTLADTLTKRLGLTSPEAETMETRSLLPALRVWTVTRLRLSRVTLKPTMTARMSTPAPIPITRFDIESSRGLPPEAGLPKDAAHPSGNTTIEDATRFTGRGRVSGSSHVKVRPREGRDSLPSRLEPLVSAPRILVADDSPLVLRMIERMLLGAGYAVITAKDGLEAVEKAMAEDVSLVILDVMMPRMNGYQACRMLKAEASTRDLPVVILTSKDQVGDRAWGLETGADYYITKDAEPQQILALVKNVLATEAPRPRPASAQRTSADILSRVNELLDHKLYEATILSEIGRVARSLVQVDATFTSVMEILARVVDFTVGAIAFFYDEDLEVALLQHRNAAPPVLEEAKARLLEALRRERPQPFEHVRARLFTPASG